VENLKTLRQALEELESSLIEFEENLHRKSQGRPLERKDLELLSIPEVCQELGIWGWANLGFIGVYRAERYPP